MRINSISGVCSGNTYSQMKKQNVTMSAGDGNRLWYVSQPNLAAISAPVQITFTGDGVNLKQLASITMENMGLGLSEAYQGGEGNVGYEMIKSFREHEGIDARSFMPFWEYDNQKGGFKFLIHKEADFPNGFDAAIEKKRKDACKSFL